MRPRAIVAVGAALMVLAFGSAAFAQTDCKKLVPASPLGPNDQTGATNRVTPAVTKAAAAEIKDGKVIVMSYPLTDGVPLFGSRFSLSAEWVMTRTVARWASSPDTTMLPTVPVPPMTSIFIARPPFRNAP